MRRLVQAVFLGALLISLLPGCQEGEAQAQGAEAKTENKSEKESRCRQQKQDDDQEVAEAGDCSFSLFLRVYAISRNMLQDRTPFEPLVSII